MYAREAIDIMTRRGFTPREIGLFFEQYPDPTGKHYTVEQIDRFEYSVNGPVMIRLHEDKAESMI